MGLRSLEIWSTKFKGPQGKMGCGYHGVFAAPLVATSLTFRAETVMWSDFLSSVICGQLRQKSPWAFAHVVRQDHVNRITRNTDQAVRTCDGFLYFIVKIKEFYDYQTWPTHLFETFRSCVQRFMDFSSWLCSPAADWLGRQIPITWWAVARRVKTLRQKVLCATWLVFANKIGDIPTTVHFITVKRSWWPKLRCLTGWSKLQLWYNRTSERNHCLCLLPSFCRMQPPYDIS